MRRLHAGNVTFESVTDVLAFVKQLTGSDEEARLTAETWLRKRAERGEKADG